jgi:hypothetical protein
MFTLCVANRDYTEWTFIAEQQDIEQPRAISPLDKKLFHGDKIDASGNLLHSPYRGSPAICGVLLTSQKTYGRSGNKLLYKCVPDAEHLPCFLLAYEEKYIGFNKMRKDKYIAFRIKEWTEKHPHGLLTETFGEVTDTDAYIAYQLTCKDLNASLKTLNAASLRALREKTLEPIPLYCENKAIEDRRALRIISIDPAGCQDIDDAIGIQKISNDQTILSIYIANVPLMLEYLQLWPDLSDRIATIYLPKKKIPMLPIALSENACSLLENTDRMAFVLDITLSKYQAILDMKYKSTIICVEKNYAYEASELLERADYKHLLYTVRELNKDFAYMDKITNSHDVVEYCMLRMNHECAKILQTKKSGIYRSASKKEGEYENFAPELKRILQSVAGEYCLYADRKPHQLISQTGLESYVHITSPIRRIVDIVNMFEILKDTMRWTAEAKEFKEKWEGQIATINKKTKASRKLQTEMELLHTYEKNPDRTYQGIVFQMASKAGASEVGASEVGSSKAGSSEAGSSEAGSSEAGSNLYKYKIYIPETKMLTSLRSTKEINNYTTVNVSAHLFLDEAKMTKKIRLQLL